MRIKSYFAGSVQEAIESARAELGSEAMLLHSKKTEWELRSLGAYEVSRGEYLARVARATPHQVPPLAIRAALDGWAERF
jgi:flagellar biosynthesis GTPase FlhF